MYSMEMETSFVPSAKIFGFGTICIIKTRFQHYLTVKD